MKLVTLKPEGRIVFVGDTHGDLDASEKVIQKYLKSGTRICFLGDYVDRGPRSKENADFIDDERQKHPDQVILLQGNHECYDILQFCPADFWESLDSENLQKYSKMFKEFPYALSVGDIIALHGALPNIKKIGEINNVIEGDINWKAMMWGDFGNEDYPFGFRPQFGKEYFNRVMKRLGKNVLIRAHQPHVEERMFDNQCLTIFTSCAYGRERTIAIVDFDKTKKVRSIDDLIVTSID